MGVITAYYIALALFFILGFLAGIKVREYSDKPIKERVKK
tara:strand:+ start:580 stop:699 length:120 start_codon:yes stop_codon:yes gene_type:complete